MPFLSDGTDTVTVGGVPVKFPTKVSEARWSPDGSRVAFIDGDGDVATAHPDGTGVVVMVKPDNGAKLSQPAWEGGTLLYTKQAADGQRLVSQTSDKFQLRHDLIVSYELRSGEATTLPDLAAATALVSASGAGTGSSIAFQHGAEIWFQATERDTEEIAVKNADGSWPALGPDGRLAFVGSDGQIAVITPVPHPAGKLPQATRLTTTAKTPTHLTWTPDGKSLAYSTPTGIEEVPADKPGPVTQLSAKPGVVTFLPAATSRVVVRGADAPASSPTTDAPDRCIGNPLTFAIMDPSDSPALAEATADGCRILTLTDGKLTTHDRQVLVRNVLLNPLIAPNAQIITFGDAAQQAAATALAGTTRYSVEALGTTHSDVLAAMSWDAAHRAGPLVVIPTDSPSDRLLADRLGGSIVTVDPAKGIAPTLKAYLDEESATISELDIVDAGSKLSPDVVRELGALISGPLGAAR